MQRFGGEGQPKEMAWSLAQAQIGDMPRGQELIVRVSGGTTWYGVAGGVARKAVVGQVGPSKVSAFSYRPWGANASILSRTVTLWAYILERWFLGLMLERSRRDKTSPQSWCG